MLPFWAGHPPGPPWYLGASADLYGLAAGEWVIAGRHGGYLGGHVFDLAGGAP